MKDTIQFEDFLTLDIRVGYVKEAENVEDSKKLIKLIVDFGAEIGELSIVTAMQQSLRPDDFVGKNFPFLVNLKPRKMAGVESQGMIMAADQDNVPMLIPMSADIRPGTVIR